MGMYQSYKINKIQFLSLLNRFEIADSEVHWKQTSEELGFYFLSNER